MAAPNTAVPVTLGVVLVTVWAVALVHQLGHYVAGRRIVGIPGPDMRIASLLVPRYLALRDESTWVLPREFERYRACYERHDPGYEQLERFVAGGEIIQTLVVVPVAVALAVASHGWMASVLVSSSIGVTVVLVAVDAVRTWRTGSLSGEYSALWHVSARVPVTFLLGFLFVHLGVFYFVT